MIFLFLNSTLADTITLPFTLDTNTVPDVVVNDIYCQDPRNTHTHLSEYILSIEVKNLGPGDVPSDVDGGLNIWIDKKLEWTYSWNTLVSQDFRTAGMTSLIQPQTLSDGTHTIKACMDPNNVLGEVSESNNCLEKVIDCGAVLEIELKN